MTTQTALIATRDYGASLDSATLRVIADDTLVATADSADELSSGSGRYSAVFVESSVIAAGTYVVRGVSGGQPITRYVTFTGTDGEVVQSRSEPTAPATPTNVTDAQTAILAKLPAALVDGRMRSYVGAMGADTLTASALAADAVEEIQSGLATPDDVSPTINFSPTINPTELDSAERAAIAAAVETELSAQLTSIEEGVDANTGYLTTLLDRVTTTVVTLWANLTSMITGSLGTAAFTSTAMANAPTGGGSSGLTGPNTVRLLISDADDAPIQNALVSMYRTGATGTVKTGDDGIAEFTVVSATWSVSIVADGFIGQTNVLVVSTHKDQTYILATSASNLPTPAGTVTGILIAKDGIESPASGITFHLQLVVGTRQSGQSPDGDARAAISGSGGLTQFAGLVPGRWYKLWRAANVAGAVEFQVPTDVSLSSAYQLPEVF